MLDLLICEFQKLKRRKFVSLTILAAFLFPIPLTILMVKDRMSFDMLFRANVMFGELLFLPCVLGIIASMLFFMERDNETLKNLAAIPVSRTKIVLSKLCTLMLLAVLYSVAGLGATVLGGVLTGNVAGVAYLLGISVVLGILTAVATLPVIVIIVACNKSYIFSIIASFVYAALSFAVTMLFSSNPETVNSIASVLPVPIIIKWYLAVVPTESALSFLLPYTVSTPVCLGIMGCFGAILTSATIFFYKKVEI